MVKFSVPRIKMQERISLNKIRAWACKNTARMSWDKPLRSCQLASVVRVRGTCLHMTMTMYFLNVEIFYPPRQ